MVEVSEFVHHRQHRFGSIHYTKLAAKVNARSYLPLDASLSLLLRKELFDTPHAV